MKITWYDGETYEGETAKEVVEKMARSSPFAHQGRLFTYTLDVAKRCWKFGQPVRPWGYKTFLKDLKKYDIVKDLIIDE
jgi:hypothetical protein